MSAGEVGVLPWVHVCVHACRGVELEQVLSILGGRWWIGVHV